MAAAVIESLTIPRPRAGFTVSSSPISSVTLRGASLLPEFRGLRITRPLPRTESAAAPSISGVAHRRAVVCEAEKTSIEVPDVTKTTWQSLVLECDTPVLVEFWASWCGPCSMIHPVISKLSKAYEGKLKFFKLNTDESPDIATQYGIRSIPTIMIFKDGERKEAVIGAVPESTMVKCIEKFV